MALEYIHTDEGRIRVKDSYAYDYYLKDLPIAIGMGNTRVVFTEENGTATELQVSNYYPFGMRFGQTATYEGSNGDNQYLYSGKELQEDFNLDWYDYGARFYDAALGRWHNLDPLAEMGRRWSPYTYCYNNPLRYIDPDGMLATDPHGEANDDKRDLYSAMGDPNWDPNNFDPSDYNFPVDPFAELSPRYLAEGNPKKKNKNKNNKKKPEKGDGPYTIEPDPTIGGEVTIAISNGIMGVNNNLESSFFEITQTNDGVDIGFLSYHKTNKQILVTQYINFQGKIYPATDLIEETCYSGRIFIHKAKTCSLTVNGEKVVITEQEGITISQSKGVKGTPLQFDIKLTINGKKKS